MLSRFKSHIKNHFNFLRESKLLIAISGGVDSVVLSHLCNEIGFDIVLAHCNFNLRGDESNADEAFVLKFANDLKLECFVESFDTKTYATEYKLSTQMAARDLRYDWFQELIENFEIDYILTGHHADDNLETFLINLSRGTGLEGLTGIPEINNNIVRPLLPFTRDEIEAYAESKSLHWVEDKSNSSTKYLRNKLRHDIIPILKGINPKLLSNFKNTLAHLKGSRQIIEDHIDQVSDEVITVKSSGIYFDIKRIQALNDPKSYIYELLKDYGFTEWNDVYDLLEAQSGKYVVSENWRLVKDRKFLILTELNKTEFVTVTLNEQDSIVPLPPGDLYIVRVDDQAETNPNTVYIDQDLLQFPLVIRKVEKGDSFYPIGMAGKKKVNKYFKDEKLSLVDKENTLLLCSGKDVIWIIGRRLDERFRVTENSKSILKFRLEV